MATAHGERRRRWALVALEGLCGASAVYGGVGLIWHDAIGMPDSWLASSPFDSWTWPGVFLLAVVALPMLASAVLEHRRTPAASAASMLAGIALVGWIAVELLVMQKYNVLQPVMIGLGLVVIVLAADPRRPVRRRAETRPQDQRSRVSA